MTANVPRALDTTLRRRGTGGVIEVRAGVWRIDVEAPRDPETGRRRRRSRLIHGTRDDAERALEEYGPALSSGTLESARADEFRPGLVERMPDAAGPVANGARRDSSPRSEKAPRRSPESGRSARRSDRLRRPQGTGGVLSVRDGVWRLSTETPRNPETGQRRRVTRVVYGTREDAELALANLRVAAARQRQPVRRADRRSMRAVFDLYLRDAKDGRIELAVKTQVTSKSAANAMCKQRLSDGRLFGEARPDRLMWADIEDLYATMRRSGLGVDWIRRCATVLNRSLEYAKKRDVVDSNPCQEATRPRTTRSKPYSPPPAVVDALTETLRKRSEQIDDPVEAAEAAELSDIVEIVAGTGVRKGELLALLVEDVDLKAQEMHVALAIADGGPGVGLVRKPTKESDWRDVPLIDSVREAFERQLARRHELTGREPRPNEYVFASDPDGTKPIRPDSLSDRLAEARGDSNVTLQDLRHYVATTMLDAGVPYRTVADLLGNSEVTLRLHYDGRTDTGKRDAVKALRRTLG